MRRRIVVDARARRERPRCPYCRVVVRQGEERWVCPRCATEHHLGCAKENKGCTIFGCEAPIREARRPAVRRPPITRRESASPPFQLNLWNRARAAFCCAVGLCMTLGLAMAKIDWHSAWTGKHSGRFGVVEALMFLAMCLATTLAGAHGVWTGEWPEDD